VVGEELVKLVSGMGAEALEDVAEVGEGIEVVALGALDQADQNGGGVATVVAAEEGPVVAAHGEPAQTSFGLIVVDAKVSVVAISDQRIPVR